ncbi:MAG: DUF3256 family protein [Prevotella sp.]|nr:DUF3256 family protein [Prevotella sp.]
MKRLWLIAWMMAVVSMAHAQAIEQWWLGMPDSLLGYMNKSKRIEAMDYQHMGLKIDVTNLLKGSTTVDTLTNEFLQVKLSEAALLQMRLLPKDSDSVVCVVKTLFAPEAESSVAFYDRNWKRVGQLTADTLAAPFLSRPDTMATGRFDELSRLVDPVMVKCTLSVSDATLTQELSLPLLTKEEKQAIKAIVKQRKLKWNGERFIEC